MSTNNQTQFELKLYPLDESEFIGTIWIEDDGNSTENSISIQTVIILDRSGSMGDEARRLTNEIIPLVLSKLSYKKSESVHLIAFETNTQHYSVTVENFESLSIQAAGGTNMAPAVRMCHSLFSSLDANKPVRVLTISDGQVGDCRETEKAATAFVEFLSTSEFSINSQAVRLFTSKSQPDTKALCSLLQINNTRPSQLADIAAKESNENIATVIAALFQTDNFSSGTSLTMETKLGLKFPWDTTLLSQIMLLPGENLFWLKKVPSQEMKISDSLVKVVMQKPVTLNKFQRLMEGKLFYIVDHMKILKVVGTVEANKSVELMLRYFEEKESNLARPLTIGKYFNVDSVPRKKISELLAAIAEDENIQKLDSAQIAEYLRGIGKTSEKTNWVDRIADIRVDIRLIIIILIILLAIIAYELVSD